MPRLIDPGQGGPIELVELVETLDAYPVDARDEDAFASWGPLLARLGRNSDFLADLAIAELKTRCAAQHAGNGYGAQVFLLRPPNGRYVLRANFWPARADSATRRSGPAAFFYDLPHDHNFHLVTHTQLYVAICCSFDGHRTRNCELNRGLGSEVGRVTARGEHAGRAARIHGRCALGRSQAARRDPAPER